MKIIAIVNFKGGVGKTTFTISVSQALALAGFRVLAIDNDGQHNLSLLLDNNDERSTVRDIYRSSVGVAGQKLMDAIRETDLRNFHIVASHPQLSVMDIKDPCILKKAITFSSLQRFYDYILIDNSPGIDVLQETAVYACDEIFMPTELSTFALSGIDEMHRIIKEKFNTEHSISKIVPNNYKNTIRQNDYLSELRERYGSKVTETAIPYDPVFENCIKERKTLFVHRLFSKAAAYYLKLIHELFDLDESRTWEQVVDERNTRLRGEARERFFQQQRVQQE